MLKNRAELKQEFEERLRAVELLIGQFRGSEKSVTLIKLENFRSDLRKALDQIHIEHFGICVNCKHSITLDRLLRNPDERFCLSCESRNKYTE